MFFSDRIRQKAKAYSNSIDVKQVEPFDKALEKRVGSTLQAVLGAGANGIAFATKDGKVFKLTRDKEEAAASANILNKNLKNVVKIYDVFEIGKLDKPLFGIVQEKLDKTLPRKYTAVVDRLYEFLDHYLTYKNVAAMSADEMFSEFLSSLSEPLSSTSSNIAKQIVAGWLQLYHNNVAYGDLQIGNVGLSNGVVKIFDLGLSDSPGVAISRLEERFASTRSFTNWVTTLDT